MKKIMALTLFCTLIPVWAAQSQVHSLLPMTNQTIRLMPQASILKHNGSLTTLTVKAGGYGGNERIGKLTYSGMLNTLPALYVSRDCTGICFLENQNVIIKNNKTNEIIKFPCATTDPDHSNLYWNADLGAVNGGYSPENDSLYATDAVTNMFKDWYGIPPFKDENGLQKPISISLHDDADNAYLEDNGFVIGDGFGIYYPLTSLNVIGYMIGELFTQQNSNLAWTASQSGGIDIAFGCMTAMAAEFYATGKNTWQVGGDIAKEGQAMHYLDMPSKNCEKGRKPGEWCDIDTLAEYNDYLINYYSSGLFNRAFYLLATTNGWDTHKTYNVFVQANRFHWRNNTNFHSGACDAVLSAKELGYDTMAVMKAFSGVGIDTRDC